MNINTLSEEKIDYKSGNLPVALYPNKLVSNKDRNTQFYAKTIIRNTCYDEDIANDIMVAGLNEGFSKAQILRVMELVRNAKLARLADAYAVDDGICKTQLRIKGTFDSEADAFSEEKHSVEISACSNSSAKKIFEKIRPVIRQGNTKKPVITEVYDVKSKSGTTLTKGGFLKITGTDIRICGDSEDVGLYFINNKDSTDFVKICADELGRNSTTTVDCVVPVELKENTYSIKIVTQYMGGRVNRKTPLESVFGNFTVA